MFDNIPMKRVNWVTSIFLFGTLGLSLTVVPVFSYINFNELDWAFQIGLFFFYFFATGFSITLGYHRLFSHNALKASWPVRLWVMLFGAATFENSALLWTSEHRKHHKHVDHEELDPYSISRGFWYAHIGWLLFKLYPSPPLDNVNDLRKDPIVMWQHNHVQTIAVFVSFILPFYIGYFYGGIVQAWGAFLIAGLLRVVVVQHGTFFINSACHYFGSQPYSTRCSARDSWFMAIFTYGEGYHNYHHEFQHDYRNGVQPWQLDPTKWLIWTLDKLGLVSNLRRVEEEKIILSQLVESQRKLNEKIEKKNLTLPAETQTKLSEAQTQLDTASNRWTELKNDYAALKHQASEASHEKVEEMNREIKKATDHLHSCIKQWKKAYSLAASQV